MVVRWYCAAQSVGRGIARYPAMTMPAMTNGRGRARINGGGESPMKISRRWLAFALSLVVSAATTVNAQTHTLDRADDGTAYQLIREIPPLGAGADATQITSIGGSIGGLGSCVQIGSMPGQPVAGVGGPNPAIVNQILFPYNQVHRSAILVPNSMAVNFDPSFGGRLTLGTGAGAIDICKDPIDCPALAPTPVLLSSSSGGVPPACVANGVAATCDGGNIRNVFAFNLPATG